MTQLTDMLDAFKKDDCLTSLSYAGARAWDLVNLDISIKAYDGGGTIVFTQKGDEMPDANVQALLEREVPYLVMFVSKPWLKAYMRTRYASDASVFRWDVVGPDGGDVKDEAVQRAAAVTLPGLLYATFGYSPQYYEKNGYQI